MSVVPLRRVASILNGGTPTPDETNWGGDVPWATPVDLAKVNGGRIRATDRRLTARGLANGSTLAPERSVLVSSRAPIGYTALAQVPMAFNQGCKAVVPVDGASERFVQYALIALTETMKATGSGSTFLEISADSLASLHVPLLKDEAQWRIADFLDDRVARIDQIIAARRQQVGLMKSLGKNNVDGLLQNFSGSWLHGPLRRFARPLDGVRIPLSSEERATRQGRYPYYGASGVIDHLDDFLFDGPKVLLSEDGANLLLRSTPIAFVARGQYWVNNHAHIMEPLDGIHEFWAARIESLDVSPWVTGSAQPKLTIEAALNLPVSAPRDHDERRNVADRIVAIRQSVDDRLKGLIASVDLLAEYKQSLITAAVTGELDVSTAGSGIPG